MTYKGLLIGLSRSLSIICAIACLFSALKTTPLTTVLGGYFTAPVFSLIISRTILKEKVGTTGYVAIGLGIAGTFMVLQPDTDFGPGSALSLLAGLFFSFYLITSSLGEGHISPTASTLVSLAFGTLLLFPLSFHDIPDMIQFSPKTISLLVAMGALTAICHFLVLSALTQGPVSSLSTLAYLELVSVVLLDYFCFDDPLEPLEMFGIILIAMAGILSSNSTSRKTHCLEEEGFA
ncbi:DMT family transporter [Litchfieldella qijiaojingensis]|uniref:DMT family transporter n=1 Tax=Litchfieldella qijiaojingensis TaxID=980347 RepID=UPI0016721A80|nr:EamA family transporter [Halomonas qijiaojingensis]